MPVFFRSNRIQHDAENEPGNLQERIANTERAAPPPGRAWSSLVAAPSRITFGFPGLGSWTRSSAQSKPDLDRLAPRADVPQIVRKTGSQKVAASERLAGSGMDMLHPVVHCERHGPELPQTVGGMASESGLRHELMTMFGDTPDAGGLADRLLAIVHPEPAGDRYPAALVLATALRTAGIEGAGYATIFLDAATRGVQTPELFKVERLLAATEVGTSALAQWRQWPADSLERSKLRDALQICSDLEAKGFAVGGHVSAAAVTAALRAMPDLRLDQPIGTDADVPLQLLAQALMHCQPEGDVAHLPAYVAWKKGGFMESGRDTDFNRAIGRMQKFLTYVDRADHGPRTLGNIARDGVALLRRTLGVGKSPLTQARHGTLGGDSDLFHTRAQKLQQDRDLVLQRAGELLIDEAGEAARNCRPVQLHEHLAKAAVLEAWHEAGRPIIEVRAVLDRARAIMLAADIPAEAFSAAMFKKSLRAFTGRSRIDGKAGTIRVGMPVLEAVGAALKKANRHVPRGDGEDMQTAHADILQLRALRQRNPEQQARLATLMARRRQNVMAMIQTFRDGSKEEATGKPLFKWADLKSLIKGAPRAGPTAEDAKQVMLSLAKAPNESMSTFSDGASHGVGSVGSASLAGPMSLGVPLVYPVLGVQSGRKAVVTAGVSAVGGRLFIGTETSKSGSLGVGAGWSVGMPGVGSATVAADLTGSRNTTQGHGLVITTRNDLEGWQEKLPQVLEFMFEQANHAKQAKQANGGGQGDAASDEPAQLWARFAQRFGDDPHVALGWMGERTDSAATRLSATGALRAQVGKGKSIGPAVNGALTAERRHFQRAPRANGAEIPLDAHSRSTSTGLSVTLAQTTPGLPASDKPFATWGAAMPLLGVAMEWNLAGKTGLARLGRTRDGRLSPALCHWEVQFPDTKTMIDLVTLRRPEWERAMVDMDHSGRTTPLQARARLNEFIDQLAALPRGKDQIHGETRHLNPQVAEQINRIEARMATILGRGDAVSARRDLQGWERAECRSIQNEVHRLLRSPQSWDPCSFWSVELNGVGRSIGLNLGLRSVNQEQFNSAHLNTLLLAETPAT